MKTRLTLGTAALCGTALLVGQMHATAGGGESGSGSLLALSLIHI